MTETLLHSKANRSEEAARMLERCVRLDAAYVPAYLLLARLYQGQEGRGSAVGRLLRHVVRLQPNSPDHLAELAAWLHHTGKYAHRQFSVQYSLYSCTYQRFVYVSEWAGPSGGRIQVEPRFPAPLQTCPVAHPASRTLVTGSNLLTCLLTAWSKVYLEKLTGFQLVKKFPAFYGTRMSITAFTSVRHLPLS